MKKKRKTASRLTACLLALTMAAVFVPVHAMAAGDPADSLVAHWSFDEGSGSAAADSVNGIKADASGGYSWSAGLSGSALKFGGTGFGGGCAAIADNNNVLGSFATLTVGAWIKVSEADAMAAANSARNDMVILGTDVASLTGNIGLSIIWNADVGKSTIGFSARGLAPDWYGSASSGPIGSYDFNVWNYVAATYDKSTMTVTFYFNGVNVGSYTYDQAFDAKIVTGYIGAYYAWGVVADARFKGSIDELKIYNAALTGGEIAAEYASVSQETPSDPFAGEVYFPFDEGSGLTSASASGGLTATLGNYAWDAAGGMNGTPAIMNDNAGKNGFTVDYGDDFSNLSDLSIGVWIKPSASDGGSGSLMAPPYGGATGSWGLNAGEIWWNIDYGTSANGYADAAVNFLVYGSDGSDWDGSLSAPAGKNLADGNWHYLAFSYSETAGTAALYADGQEIGSKTYTSALPINLQAYKWFGGNGYQGRAYLGLLDSFSVIPSCLDGAAQEALYERGAKQAPKEILFPFNEGYGASSGALSGGLTATLKNYNWNEDGRGGTPAIMGDDRGANGFLIDYGPDYANLSELSVGVWVKPKPADGQVSSLMASQYGGVDGVSWRFFNGEILWNITWGTAGNGYADTTINFLSFGSDGSDWDSNLSVPAGKNLADGGWHYLAFSFSETGKTVTLYVDGAPVGSKTYVSTFPANLQQDHWFGGNGYQGWGYTGVIDELSVFTAALDDAAQAALYNRAPNTQTAAPPKDPADTDEVGDNIYYVATNGSDSNPGTEAEPFLTIQKAADVLLPGETVVIREGVYQESVRPKYNGTPSNPITYKAADGEKVTVSGADKVQNGWTKVDGGNPAGVQYDPAGSNNLWKVSADLPMGNYRNQVFVDYGSGFREVLSARYPNVTPGKNPYYEPNWLSYWFSGLSLEYLVDGVSYTRTLDEIGGSYGGHACPAPGGYGYGKILGKPEEINQPADTWKGASVIGFDNRHWQVSGAEVTASTPSVAVSPKDPGSNYNGPSAGCWLTLTNLNFYELGPKGYSAGYYEYYLQNAFAALDAENEWWYDGGGGTLWLQLPTGQDPNSLDVYYKARATGMDMSGRKNIVMEGVDLLGCGFSMANAENCVIDGMTALYPASVLSPGNESEVSGAVISGSNNTLMNSEIAYCSGPILSISGQGHKIVNNKLHDAITGPILYKFLLNIQGRDHLIKNNEIYNARGALIGGTFYACEISYNRMYNANWQVSDTGIMYMAYGDYGGTQIHHNIFYNSLQNFSCGVYFDLNCKNALVYNNVMYDIPWAAMFINSGAEFISAINNTAYNTAQGRSTEEIYSNAPNDMYMSIFANNIVDSRGVGTDNADVGAIAFNNYARPQGDASTFNGPAYHDFTLQPGSGAIGYGAGIPGLHDTQTVDAGAFQYGAEPWQAGVLPYKATLSDVSAGARIIPNVLQNLLKNSAFEWPRLGEDTPGDGNSIPYWTKTGAKTASVHTSTGDLATWAHSREERAIDLTGGAGDGIEQTVTGLTPGAEYIVRGFARMGTPGGAADGQQVEIGVRIGGESVASQTLNAARWREARIKFTADGSGTATVYATKTTDGSRALVDDFSVVLAGYVSEEAPVVGDEYPMYNSPVALVDDMLYGAAPWDVSANAEFAKDEPTGLTLASADGAPAYAFYTKEKYSDKDFYMMLDGSQALDALDMTVELGARDSDLSLNPNRYEIAVKGGAVTLVRWYNTTPYTLGEWPFNASSPLIKARSTFDLGESSYGTVTITLKSGNDVIFTYADNSNLNIPAPGYFGLATSSSVKLARVTEYVPIGNLIADQANWVAGSTITWGGDGTWMTLDEGSGGAGAGYIGRKFGDSEFVMAFKAGLYPGSYPYIAMRVQNEAQLKRLNWFRDGNAYQIIIKEDIFETQEWGTGADNNGILFYTDENGATVPGIADNHAFVPPDTSTLIKTSIVNTDYGVWLRLKVGDTIVSSWMDQNKYILSDGYFGFAATHEPVTLSVPNADTYAPEIGDPDKVATEEKYDTTLASLAVDGYDLVPAFDPAVLEYGLTIPGNVETVNISAAAASDKAAVSGDLGAMSAAVGENVYHVYVQAPNGDTTAYTVTVTRETPAVFVMTVKSMAAKIGKPLQIPFTYEGPGPVTFKSSNSAVCGVTSAGVLTPLKAGIAVITVSAPGFANYVFAVTVTA